MKIRMYVDLVDGYSHASASQHAYASSKPIDSVSKGYKRYYFDVDFPPGTFAEERSTQLPSAAAKEM